MSHDDSGSRFEDGPHPPREEELRRTIERIADFVAKYGPESEEKVQRDNRGNPKFEFLFGGPYHDYYKFLVHMMINSMGGGGGGSMQAPHQQGPSEEEQIRMQINQLRQQISDSERNLKAQLDSQPAMKEAQLAQQVVAAEEQKIAVYLNNVKLDITHFVEVLHQLNNPKCSKDAISNSKKWIFENCLTDQQREVILTYLLSRVKDAEATDSFRLNILYLINDWAHHCQRKRLDPVTQMLSRYVPQMYSFTIECAADVSLQQKLDKLTGVWEGHKYFNDQCFKQLRNPTHIYTTTKAAQSAEYAKLASNIEVQLQAMYAGYEQQHNNYVQHVAQQIAQLESQLPEFRQQHHAPMGGGAMGGPGAPPSRRSRFDQQSRFEEEPPNAHGGGGGAFGRFFAPPPRAQPKQGWMEDERYAAEPKRAPDGDDIDGHPFDEDDLIPKAPYFELPAGVMVPLVTFENLTYIPIDPSAIRLPPPVPPSQRLMDAMDAFYGPPSLDRPRDASGWERDGLSEFFERKMRLKKILQDKLNGEGKTLDQLISNKMTEEDLQLIKEDREAKIGKEMEGKKNGGRRSRSRSNSGSRSRSRSGSKSRRRRRRSRSSSSSGSSSSSSSGSSRSRSPRRRSRSRSLSPARRSFNKRSPTPPSFGGSSFGAGVSVPLSTDNKGALLMQKMGWSGRGLGAQESGIVEPINPGEVRDRIDQFRGLGSKLDPFEQYRKNRSGNYHDRNQTVFAEREKTTKPKD